MQEDWNKIEALLSGLNAEVGRSTMPSRVKALATYVKDLSTDFDIQKNASNDADLPRLEHAVRILWQEVEHATGTGAKRPFKDRILEQFSVGAIFGVLILVVAVGGVAWLLIAYIGNSSLDSLRTIDGARPLLTIAAIIATARLRRWPCFCCFVC